MFETSFAVIRNLRTNLLVRGGVNFGDKPAGEPHHGGLAIGHAVGLDHNARSRCFCFHKSIGKIVDLVPRCVAPIGIWEMTIGGQHSDFSERRIHPYAAIPIIGPSNLDAGRLGVVRDYLRLRKSSKVADKIIGTIRRYVDRIFRNRLQTGEVRRRASQ
jgi:hypothetical protein